MESVLNNHNPSGMQEDEELNSFTSFSKLKDYQANTNSNHPGQNGKAKGNHKNIGEMNLEILVEKFMSKDSHMNSMMQMDTL